jgi:hypothetical protein
LRRTLAHGLGDRLIGFLLPDALLPDLAGQDVVLLLLRLPGVVVVRARTQCRECQRNPKRLSADDRSLRTYP